MMNKLISIVCLALVLILCLGGCVEISESGVLEGLGTTIEKDDIGLSLNFLYT